MFYRRIQNCYVSFRSSQTRLKSSVLSSTEEMQRERKPAGLGGGVCVGVSVCSCMCTWERSLKKQNCLLGNISQGILIKLQSPTTSRSGPIIHIF